MLPLKIVKPAHNPTNGEHVSDRQRDGVWWAGCCDPKLVQVASGARRNQGPFSTVWSMASVPLFRFLRWLDQKTQAVGKLKMEYWRKND